MFSDVARLVRMVERRLEERGVDIEALLQPSTCGEASASADNPLGIVSMLQLLWAELVCAEEASWQEVLIAHEGRERNVLLASLGFCRVVRWREGDSTPTRMPSSAKLEPLCEAFAALRPLAPALRLVGDDSLFVAGIAASSCLPKCSVAAATASRRFHSNQAAAAVAQ